MDKKKKQQPPTMAATVEAKTDDQIAMEEEHLKESMKQLKLLHIKVRLLRDTIPKMLEPLVQKQASHAMFAAFMKAVGDAQADVSDFTELMRNETSKGVFAQVDKSVQENPMGIKPWRHKDYPNWCNLDKDD